MNSDLAPARMTSDEAVGAHGVFAAAARVAFQPTRRNLLHWISWAVALSIELALVALLRDGRIYGWEQSLTRRLQDVPGKRIVYELTSPLSNVLGLPVVPLVLAIAAVFLAAGHRVEAALALLMFPLHILAQFPKALFDRPRPSAAFPGIEGVGGGNSFPSGHSEYAVAFYGFLIYLLLRHVDGRWRTGAIIACWLLFVLGTGFGRIALGRHWPLDVLTGWLVGLGLLSGLIWLHAAFRAPHPPSAPSPPPSSRSPTPSSRSPTPSSRSKRGISPS